MDDGVVWIIVGFFLVLGCIFLFGVVVGNIVFVIVILFFVKFFVVNIGRKFVVKLFIVFVSVLMNCILMMFYLFSIEFIVFF